MRHELNFRRRPAKDNRPRGADTLPNPAGWHLSGSKSSADDCNCDQNNGSCAHELVRLQSGHLTNNNDQQPPGMPPLSCLVTTPAGQSLSVHFDGSTTLIEISSEQRLLGFTLTSPSIVTLPCIRASQSSTSFPLRSQVPYCFWAPGPLITGCLERRWKPCLDSENPTVAPLDGAQHSTENRIPPPSLPTTALALVQEGTLAWPMSFAVTPLATGESPPPQELPSTKNSTNDTTRNRLSWSISEVAPYQLQAHRRKRTRRVSSISIGYKRSNSPKPAVLNIRP